MKSLPNFCQIFNKNWTQQLIQWYIQQIQFWHILTEWSILEKTRIFHEPWVSIKCHVITMSIFETSLKVNFSVFHWKVYPRWWSSRLWRGNIFVLRRGHRREVFRWRCYFLRQVWYESHFDYWPAERYRSIGQLPCPRCTQPVRQKVAITPFKGSTILVIKYLNSNDFSSMLWNLIKRTFDWPTIYTDTLKSIHKKYILDQ